MSVKYIGRVTSFSGKRLFDILCRLKNFGTGRVVYRHVFNERYEEPSYYVITKVEPDMSDPTLKEWSDHLRGRAFGIKVFRGENHGERAIHSAYKADWRLVPKDQEATFLNYKKVDRPRPVIPRYVALPPLLHHFTALEYVEAGRDPSEIPQLEIKINHNISNRAVLEGESGTS